MNLRILLVAATLIAVTADAQGQVPDSARSDTLPRGARPAARTTTGLLDAPVDRQTYQLGPGDEVTVSIIGDVNRQFHLTVTPEGSLVLPGMGVANVLGATVANGEARLRELVGRYYRNADVRLNLAAVRSFKVYVVGRVPDPGVRVATSVTRVSEVVPAVSPFGTPFRNILLRRNSGESLRVDLSRFVQLGELSSNPVLREGDAVVVPELGPTVQIRGRVRYPGRYEFRAGESLADLIEVANGGEPFIPDAADSIRMVRFTSNGGRELITMARTDALTGRGRQMHLQPSDAVYLPSVANFRTIATATIRGQVVRPGIYPIRPDTTTLRELIETAGGFTTQASLVTATLERPPVASEMLLSELDAIPPELLTDEERSLRQARSQYQVGLVRVDFESLYAAGRSADDVRLRDGDIVNVPERREEVTVLGAVREPGLVPFMAGQGVNAFVERAGGYSDRANRGQTVVVKARTGTRLSASDVRSVEPGDVIVVPVGREVPWQQRVQTVSFVVSTITGLILTYLAVFDRN